MATELIQRGIPTTLTRNVVYALPGKFGILFSSTAGAAFEQSNTVGFAADINMVLTDGESPVAGAFIRSTAGDALVIIRGF